MVFETTYGLVLEDFKKVLLEVQKIFTPLHENFLKNKLYGKDLQAKEYLGSFARTEDFEDKSKYIYLVEDTRGNVGFVGIKLNNKSGYTKVSVDLVKDVSKALIFETPNHKECCISQVSSYLFKTVKPMALDFAFKPTEELFPNEKMQAIANIVLKKKLEKELNQILPPLANEAIQAMKKKNKI